MASINIDKGMSKEEIEKMVRILNEHKNDYELAGDIPFTPVKWFKNKFRK